MIEHHTHVPVPIPAFDKEGNQIMPADWNSKLRGADVIVKFTVSHQWLGKTATRERTDNYYADIVEIRLLREPRPPPTSPLKRGRDEASDSRVGKTPKSKKLKTCAYYYFLPIAANVDMKLIHYT